MTDTRHPFHKMGQARIDECKAKGSQSKLEFDPSLQVVCSCGATATKKEILAGDVSWVRKKTGWACTRCSQSERKKGNGKTNRK